MTWPPAARRELESALAVVSSCGEVTELVLFHKYLVLDCDTEHALDFNETDALSDS